MWYLLKSLRTYQEIYARGKPVSVGQLYSHLHKKSEYTGIDFCYITLLKYLRELRKRGQIDFLRNMGDMRKIYVMVCETPNFA